MESLLSLGTGNNVIEFCMVDRINIQHKVELNIRFKY